MKTLNVFLMCSMVFCAEFGLAQSKRVLPLPPPDVTCVSKDKFWQILVNSELGIIRVVDVKQSTLSHKVTGSETIQNLIKSLYTTTRTRMGYLKVPYSKPI